MEDALSDENWAVIGAVVRRNQVEMYGPWDVEEEVLESLDLQMRRYCVQSLIQDVDVHMRGLAVVNEQ